MGSPTWAFGVTRAATVFVLYSTGYTVCHFDSLAEWDGMAKIGGLS
jgi:hypothetical protein